MSRSNSNGGWMVLAAIVAVLAWSIMKKGTTSQAGLNAQLNALAEQIGTGMASIYGFIEDQLNPTVHADPAPSACAGGTCFDADINLTGSFTTPDNGLPTGIGDYQSAYQGALFPYQSEAGVASTVAQLTP